MEWLANTASSALDGKYCFQNHTVENAPPSGIDKEVSLIKHIPNTQAPYSLSSFE
jgi:hypothetical protein